MAIHLRFDLGFLIVLLCTWLIRLGRGLPVSTSLVLRLQKCPTMLRILMWVSGIELGSSPSPIGSKNKIEIQLKILTPIFKMRKFLFPIQFHLIKVETSITLHFPVCPFEGSL